jgi:hypothetical protein
MSGLFLCCDYCLESEQPLFEVEVHFEDFFYSTTRPRILCKKCIKHELKDEGLKYTIIGEKK